MEIIQIVSCVGTLICALFAILAYFNTRTIKASIRTNSTQTVTGDQNRVQDHSGIGDNIGGDKNG